MFKKKILVLMKRFGSNKDMVKENFGREIRLFEQLSRKYDIDFLCFDYNKKQRLFSLLYQIRMLKDLLIFQQDSQKEKQQMISPTLITFIHYFLLLVQQ